MQAIQFKQDAGRKGCSFMLPHAKAVIGAGAALSAYLLYRKIAQDKTLVSKDESELAAKQKSYRELQASSQAKISNLNKQIQGVQNAINMYNKQIQATKAAIASYHTNNATIQAQIAKY